MNRVDLCVIGGGPAGMAAAAAAARAGAGVALIDDHSVPGGKVLTPAAGRLTAGPVERYEKRFARRLRAGLRSPRIRCLFGQQVWHIEKGWRVHLAPVGGAARSVEAVSCRSLVIAAGAMERVIPFPGWILPGVFTLGGLNGWAKHGVVPGERVLLAGSGPLLLALAHNLMRSGARIAAVVSMTPPLAPFRYALPLAASMGGAKAFQLGLILARLAFRQVRTRHSTIVSEVAGPGSARQATLTRIDAQGCPVPGTERTLDADVVAVGYGLIPGTDLTRCCGCRDDYDAERGYWRVRVDGNLESSVPGVFVAGDGAAVKGYAAAADEGELAGTAAAARLGFASADTRRADFLRRRVVRARRFGRILDILSVPPPGLFESVPDRTVVCRCEETTLGDIRRAVADGAVDIHDLKRRTRLGMGHCQGRICGQVANEALWRAAGRRRPRERFTARIPARPVALEELF